MFVIKTRVGPSSIHGTGVFACENVAIGEPVWRFHPPFDQILSERDIADLPKAAREYLANICLYIVGFGRPACPVRGSRAFPKSQRRSQYGSTAISVDCAQVDCFGR